MVDALEGTNCLGLGTESFFGTKLNGVVSVALSGPMVWSRHWACVGAEAFEQMM